jgi:hypothetical protein
VAYIVDQTVFHAEGALISWTAAAQRLNIPLWAPLPTAIELRWILSAGIGMPTEPFVVWVHPHSAEANWQPLAISQKQLLFLGLFELVTWSQGSVSSVSVDIQAPSGGAIFAFAGGPLLSNICAVTSVPTGNTTIELSAHIIDGLLVAPGITITAVRGLLTNAYANAPGWTPIELVGLPVKQADWSGIGKHGEPQGMVGSFTDAQTAAIARLTRGGPPIGWALTDASGNPEPNWIAPNFTSLVGEVNSSLLGELKAIVKDFAPDQQAGQTITVPLPPPETSLGQRMGVPATTTTLAPLVMTLMAASIDPFLSLVLGFGTAYPSAKDAAGAPAGSGALDFMITARWEKGLNGKSAPADYAAIIPAPVAPPAPPPPANIFTEVVGTLRPLAPDGNWRSTSRIGWDRPPRTEFFRTASFAATRTSVTPAAPVVALMAVRPSGGYRPIAINQAADPPDPEFYHLNTVDREVEIPSNPGTLQLSYAAAVQDIYGQWTPWISVAQTLAQPALEPVRLVSATLKPIAPASGSVCATSLNIEFLWDWRIRTPRQITFVGRMYPGATHGTSPPSLVVPAGLDRSLAGGGAALVVTFSSAVPSAPGATIIPLTEDGENNAGSFGAAQGSDARRYRLTLSGLSLDFGATPFIGLAIWAMGQELIAPQRLSAWSDKPLVVATGDPRPPILQIEHVTLGSLPDATGSSHVRIHWPTPSNAVGFFIYEATESNMLDAFGLPSPTPSDTLDARLAVLKNAFRANPLRRPFTRLNASATTASSMDIALPRGSTSIHLYVVLGVSAGQVESAWPSGPTPDDSLIAIAAPHVAKPAPPMLETQRILDNSTNPPTYKASLTIASRTGPRPKQIDIHRVRVDDAARELDSMGPPIASLTASAGGWVVQTTNDPTFGPYISSVTGTDAPAGSWKRVWYRATAWTAPDPTRGALPGRSDASTATFVVLPPPDPPVLSPLLIGTGPGPADVVLQWTCTSPVPRTPLGPHRITLRAVVPGTPPQGPPGPLLALDSTVDQLGRVQPATGSGAWIVTTAPGVTTYRALVRRAAIAQSFRFVASITDPIGRSGEQLAIVASGPVDPPPDVENLKVQRIPTPLPARTVLTFTSSSPIQAPLDGPYVLKITALPPIPHPFPPPPTVQMALGAVPTRPPLGPPPVLYVVRSGVGPTFTYMAVTTASVGHFVVRITAPNAQFIEKVAT